MKVIVLGGTGDMGRLAVRELGRTEDVELLTVAGRDLAKAQERAAAVGDHARAAAVDARDHAQLVEVISGHDVVAGALGPFYLFEVPVAKAAIAAGVPYVSICDDYDATQAVFALDEAARHRGITILTGLGWTPGLTNILARKGVSLLDSAKQIHISWAGASADAEGLAVILHTMHIFTGRVPTFAGGAWQEVLAGSGRQVVTFPQPVGSVTVYHVGHPEPVTIPRFLPGVEEVSLRGGLAESLLTSLSIAIARLGLTRTPQRRARLARLMKPMLPRLERLGIKKTQPMSAAHVEVWGTKDGQPARVELTAVGRMADLTSLPLVVGTLMLGRGEIRSPGVLAPEAEGGPDPDRFLKLLAGYGLSISVERC
jgi:lysine 6-dehydrogenase